MDNINKNPEKKQVENRDEQGHFVKGKSGNPECIGVGRPKGAGISITTEIKRKLHEIPEGQKKTYLEMLILKILKKAISDEDSIMIKQIWNYIDGMPKEHMELGLDEDIKEVAIKIIGNDIKSESDKDIQ